MSESTSLRDLANSLDAEELTALASQFDAVVGSATQAARRGEVGQAFRESGVTLVLGAGVSMGVGAPSWGELMGRLVLAVIGRKLEPGAPISDAYLPFSEILGQSLPTDALVVAHYAKLALAQRGMSSADDAPFLRVLRSALYAGSKPVSDSELLGTLSDLCRGSAWQRARGVQQVITYNYDRFFEEALTAAHCEHETVPRKQRARGDGLPVYHPHGIVGRDPSSSDDWVILAEDEYHREYAAPHSWSNIVQLNAFSQSRCIFVGLSMTDPNLRRLLAAARTSGAPEHFAFLRRRDPKAALARIEASHTWGSGATGSLRDDLAARVAIACRGGDVADDTTLAELGTQVIWYDEHQDLPGVLRGCCGVH